MRPIRFAVQPLRERFEQLGALTMPEMKAALGTTVDVTVFRKLASLDYRSSYSHRGAFYTLDSIAQFDEPGLWCCRGAWFSRQGTLLNTVVAQVESAPAGCLIGELQALLGVPVKDALRQMAAAGRLHRKEHEGFYLYLSRDRTKRQQQRAARQAQEAASIDEEEQAIRAARVLFYSLLDEQKRRLFAGLESLKEGRGGDSQLARALGLAPKTVARGRRELLAGQVEPKRVRRAGGGRPRAEKKRHSS
jgi:hypothetical protein